MVEIARVKLQNVNQHPMRQWMARWLALGCLVAAAGAQIPPTVKVQNISGSPLRQWVMCGLPEAVPEQSLRAGAFPAYAKGHELHVFADLAAASEIS